MFCTMLEPPKIPDLVRTCIDFFRQRQGILRQIWQVKLISAVELSVELLWYQVVLACIVRRVGA